MLIYEVGVDRAVEKLLVLKHVHQERNVGLKEVKSAMERTC